MSNVSAVVAAPLDRTLNVAILQMAARLFPTGFDVAEDAPNTLADLQAQVANTGRMLVYSGGSDATIYACPEVNYAFRAWHDWCHLAGGFAFTAEGEAQACAMQQDQLRRVFGASAQVERWCAILDAEINGQVAFHAATGDFPVDQVAFVRDYLAGIWAA